MKYSYRPGEHYDVVELYSFKKNQPYDYKRKGIIKNLMTPRVFNTQNSTTKMIVEFIEAVAQFLVEYVGELRNFKNPFYHKH